MKHQSLGIKKPKSKYIAQGEFAVETSPESLISTILGSCVATCLWDPERGVGGMNHFLLPDSGGGDSSVSSFGVNAMELLINALIKSGAQKDRLRAKVFGGAEMYKGLTNAGNKNGEFVLEYLSRENIPCDAYSLGGTHARRIEFSPTTGKARQKLVEDTPVENTPTIIPKVETNDLELF